jgi:hypothetical protein
MRPVAGSGSSATLTAQVTTHGKETDRDGYSP